MLLFTQEIALVTPMRLKPPLNSRLIQKHRHLSSGVLKH